MWTSWRKWLFILLEVDLYMSVYYDHASCNGSMLLVTLFCPMFISDFFRSSMLSASYRGQNTLDTSKTPLFYVTRSTDNINISCSITITGEPLVTKVVRVILPEFNRTNAMWTKNTKKVQFAACAWPSIEMNNIRVLWKQYLKFKRGHMSWTCLQEHDVANRKFGCFSFVIALTTTSSLQNGSRTTFQRFFHFCYLLM